MSFDIIREGTSTGTACLVVCFTRTVCPKVRLVTQSSSKGTRVSNSSNLSYFSRRKTVAFWTQSLGINSQRRLRPHCLRSRRLQRHNIQVSKGALKTLLRHSPRGLPCHPQWPSSPLPPRSPLRHPPSATYLGTHPPTQPSQPATTRICTK
ncbi:hypothetical protein BKA80DRAFT_123528 [Phyllosticta citrichinensis]